MKNQGIIIIPVDKLYHGYKEELVPFYEKYFAKDGNPLLWKNVPLTIFASDYVKLGKEILKHLDSHCFIQNEYSRYADAESVKNDTHKFAAARRIMKMVDSVKKHGYAEGKYDKPKHMIKAVKGFESPYGSDKDGFTLLARKHRAAAAIALGQREIRVRVFS